MKQTTTATHTRNWIDTIVFGLVITALHNNGFSDTNLMPNENRTLSVQLFCANNEKKSHRMGLRQSQAGEATTVNAELELGKLWFTGLNFNSPHTRSVRWMIFERTWGSTHACMRNNWFSSLHSQQQKQRTDLNHCSSFRTWTNRLLILGRIQNQTHRWQTVQRSPHNRSEGAR